MIHRLQALLYVLLALALCWLGKHAYAFFHPHERVDHELTAKDNVAFALPMGAYFLGILIALGAPLGAPSQGSLLEDLVFTFAWGLSALVVLNVASRLSDKTLLRGFDASAEILERRNLSAGYLRAGAQLANGLLILGAFSGNGGLLPCVVFWVYGQVWLALAGLALPYILGCDLADQVRKDNQAVAVAAAGGLVAVGNVLRLALTGDFTGWTPAVASVTGYAAVGLAFLFIIRELVDWLLLPKVTMRHELLGQKVPNVGVGYLMAVFYVGTSILVGWCL
ncbi:MAG: hypothetical protein NTX64_01640 [Elusimicrobia bacterium]|nr:hypothetical protein [Elusimicrobiota bacterium]